MKVVPIHLLEEKSWLQIEIMRYEMKDVPYVFDEANIHRNDHYIFLICEKGSGEIMVDFKNITLIASSVYYAIPGQINHRVYNQCMTGWYLAIDRLLVPNEFRSIFEVVLGSQIPLILSQKLLHQCHSILSLIDDRLEDKGGTRFDSQVTYTLLQSFTGIVAGAYSSHNDYLGQNSRIKQITLEFKMILTNNFRTIKSPSAYAQRLNITVNYLNEAVKKSTGFSVSYWITGEILMEAKRLLFHTTSTVKEIAYAVGYEDVAYFSKLFKKHEGLTPTDFRDKKQWIVQP